MRYYTLYDNNNKLIAIGTGYGGTEITEAEYHTLLEKATFADQLYAEEITLADIPAEWQEEIQRRVNERIEADGLLAEQDISADEALDIILGGESV